MPDRTAQASEGWLRTLPVLRGAAIFVIVGGLKAGRQVLLPLLLAVFIAGLGIPVLEAMQRRGVRPSLAVAGTFTGLTAALVGIAFLMVRALSGFLAEVPVYVGLLAERFQTAMRWLVERGAVAADWSDRLDLAYLVEKASGLLGGTLLGVTSATSFSLLTLVFLLFVLVEAIEFDDKLRRALGDRQGAIAGIHSVTRNIQRYVVIKTATSAVVGALAAGATALVGVDFPLVWGMLAFFLHYIPVVGAIIAAVPAVLLALAQLGIGPATIVAVAYLTINFVIGNLLEPVLMGRPLGLSPLAVLVSLAFWGWVWGPVGAVLSVPLTLVIKILLEESGQLRWLSVLLGPAPSRDLAEVPPSGAADG